MATFISIFSTSWAIAKKNLTKQMRENILGVLWTFLTPVIYALFFILVKQSLSGNNSTSMNYYDAIIRAFVGISLLQLWFQIIQEITQVVRANKGVLRALTVDIYPFILSILIDSFFSLCIRCLLILISLVYFKVHPDISWLNFLLLLSAFASIILTALFIGLLLAPWASLFNDIRKILSSALMPMALISPIFYPATTNPDTFLYWFNQINPIAAILAVISDIFFSHTPVYVDAMLIWLFTSAFLILFLVRFLKRETPILLERMSS